MLVFDGQRVLVDGRAVHLTPTEFALLAYIWQRRGQVLSRARLLVGVWGSDHDRGPRTVDVHVRRLRAKLGRALPLETVRSQRGCGYKLACAE